MAKFQVTFRVYPPEECSLDCREALRLTLCELNIIVQFASIFSDEDLIPDISETGTPHVRYCFSVSVAKYRGSNLLYFCCLLAKNISHSLDGYNVKVEVLHEDTDTLVDFGTWMDRAVP